MGLLQMLGIGRRRQTAAPALVRARLAAALARTELRQVRARYDLAQTGPDNQKHWGVVVT